MLKWQCWQWRHSETLCCMLKWHCWQWRHSVTLCCMLQWQCWQWRHSVHPWLQDHIMKTARRSLISTLNEDKQSASRSSLCAPAKSPRNPLGGTLFQWQECVILYHRLKFYISIAAGSSIGMLLSYQVDCSSVGILLSYLVVCSSLGVLVSYLVGCSSVGLFLSYLVGCSLVGIHLSYLVGCSSLGIFMSYLDGCISVGTLLSYVVVWKASPYTWKLCNAGNGSLSAWSEHLCENVWL
jgi:hypothetical protein